MGALDKLKSFKIRDRGPPAPPKYEFEVVILKPGVNFHTVYTDESMEHEHEGPGDVMFKIKAENLFKLSPGIMDKIRFKLNRIDSKFIVIFQQDQDTPISYEQPTYTSRVLKQVAESKALSEALKDEFAKDMNFKTMFMYFMLLVGAGLVFLFVTGQVSI